jgi:hypothetical protein
VAFANIKKQQEAYDACHAKQQKYNAVSLGSDFLSDTDVDDDDEAVIIQKRTHHLCNRNGRNFCCRL